MSQNWDELGLRENNNRTLSLLSLFWPMARTLLLCPGQPSCCSLAKWANICNVLHHYHIPCVTEGVLHINMSHGLEANPTIIRSALQLWARRRLIQALFERLAALETDGACSARSIPGLSQVRLPVLRENLEGFVHVSIMFLMFAGKWVEMKLTSYSIYIDGHCSCKNILSSNMFFCSMGSFQ